MKKTIDINEERIVINSGDHSVVLYKRPVDGHILMSFSFEVTTFILNRIRNTGIVTEAQSSNSKIIVKKKDFYTHEKMAEVLTDIIELQHNGNN